MKQTKMMKKNYEFKNVLSKGNYYGGRYIEAFILKGKQEQNNFLGIAISKKIAKAVMRNQIKRWIRENYYEEETKIKTGYEIVFLWKKKVSTQKANFSTIQTDMKKIFDKAGLNKEENK